jgi:hypothetical protein
MVKSTGNLFWRVTLGAVLALCVFVALLQWFWRPDPARTHGEQADVFSAYLFEYPAIARPLPALCGDTQRYYSERSQSVVVASQTVSANYALRFLFAATSIRSLDPGIPWSALDNLVIRNLFSDRVSTLKSPPNTTIDFSQAVSDQRLHAAALSVRFSNVGFDQNFSNAIVYTEVWCDGREGAEYAYFARDAKHGNQWYVASIRRVKGGGPTGQSALANE